MASEVAPTYTYGRPRLRQRVIAAVASLLINIGLLLGILVIRPVLERQSAPATITVQLVALTPTAPARAKKAPAPDVRHVQAPVPPPALTLSSTQASPVPDPGPARPATPAAGSGATTAPIPQEPLPAGPLNLGAQLALTCSEHPAPRYPESSRRAGDTGTAVVRVELGESGNIDQVAIAQSSGHADLDRAALAAVRRWRCAAPRQAGHPVRAIAEQPFAFSLNPSRQSERQKP